jgi:hypothetical protein
MASTQKQKTASGGSVAGSLSAPLPGKVYVRVVNVRCSLTFCVWKLPVSRASLPIVARPGGALTGKSAIASLPAQS